MFILSSITIILMLFVLSAFWSGSETALTSLSKYRVQKIIALKKSVAPLLMQWLKSPYYLLTTILVGNTITNITLSFLATMLVLHVFLPIGKLADVSWIVSVLFSREFLELATWFTVTFLLLVFGEVTPKIFCRSNPEKVTIFSLPILEKATKISIPFVWPLRKLVRLLFPQANLFPISRLTSLSLEEVKDLIKEADMSGMLGAETSQMLQRALKLGDVSVEKIMTPLEKVEAVNLDQDNEKFLDLLVETGRTRVPVYHGALNRIAGFVHTKDLLSVWQKNKGRFSDELIRPPYFVAPDKKIYDLMRELQSGRSHMAFVADPMGNLIGLVTLEDILEEIVGEILDEYDIDEKET